MKNLLGTQIRLPNYPGGVDRVSIDPNQTPNFFDFDKTSDALPGIAVKDGWAYFKIPFLWLTKDCFDDLQVSISNVRIPTSSAPTERLYNHGIGGGVTFPVLGFAVNDYLYFDVQSTHSMELNSILDHHIHYMTPTDGSGTPDRFKFRLDVIAAPINGNWAVPTGSPFTVEHIIAASYVNAHKLLDVANIPAVNTTVSTLYKCKLTRVAAAANEYAGEVYVEFTDCHFNKDSVGSRTEAAK